MLGTYFAGIKFNHFKNFITRHDKVGKRSDGKKLLVLRLHQLRTTALEDEKLLRLAFINTPTTFKLHKTASIDSRK